MRSLCPYVILGIPKFQLLNRYMERGVFADFTEDVQFITPDVTQMIKLYEGGASYNEKKYNFDTL